MINLEVTPSRLTLAALSVVLMAVSPLLAAGRPGPEALRAWADYEAKVGARHSTGPTGAAGVFFVQDLAGGPIGWRQAALRGEVPTSAVETPGAPGAAIHHWVGAVFLPGVTLDTVLHRLVEQAGTEHRLYDDVLSSRLLTRDGDRLTVFMKLRRSTVITVVYNTEHDVEYRRLGAARGLGLSRSTRIAELADAGTPAEREKPPGADHGFLWRLNAYWRYEETAGGVLVECESLSLSRSVPLLARPIVSPIVARVARESLIRTLRNLRSVLAPTRRDRASSQTASSSSAE